MTQRLLKHWLKGKAASFQRANPHLHPKASVWFISPILSQCLLICHGRERSHNGASFLRPGMLQEALYEPLDPSLIYKWHLYIYLKTEKKCAFTVLLVSTKPAKQETIHKMTSQHDCIRPRMCLGSPSRLMTQATTSSESEWGKDDKDIETALSEPG